MSEVFDSGENGVGLDTVELIMELEDRFRLRIPDELAEKMETIGDCVDGVAALLTAVGRGDEADRTHILKVVCDVSARQFGVPVESLKPQTSFVKDLGLN